MQSEYLFQGRRFAAFLFDLDGTLINSIGVAERVWGDWARRQGLDVAAFLPTVHGVRSVDTIRRLDLPGIDPELEAQAISKAEMEDIVGVVSIEGADTFLASLPLRRWAIVTSAPRTLAVRRILAAGLPEPDVLVAAEDVTRGKPAPDCYQLAAQRLGVDARACLVFEDAAPGIAAAEAAGSSVVAISATHAIETSHLALAGYCQIRVVADGEGLALARTSVRHRT
ncbi:MAG TPA: HAD-IA family hydrolase [Sphingobium sp.]